jgi:hypothetical protein
MTPLTILWLPIIISAVGVFIASSLIHMVLKYHQNDFRRVPSEDQLIEDLRRANLAPGEYAVPHAATPRDMDDPAYIEKATRGPVALLTVVPNGKPSMTKPLALWFLFSLIVSLTAGYVAGRALAPGAEYLEVFRFVGTTALAAYVFGLWQQSIWFGRPWSTTLKSSFDGVVYALLTAGVFGWLWPA